MKSLVHIIFHPPRKYFVKDRIHLGHLFRSFMFDMTFSPHIVLLKLSTTYKIFFGFVILRIFVI